MMIELIVDADDRRAMAQALEQVARDILMGYINAPNGCAVIGPRANWHYNVWVSGKYTEAEK